MLKPVSCPICEGKSFSDYHGRSDAQCDECGALERTRIAKLLIDQIVRLRPDARVLHLRPEPGLAAWLHRTVGEGYDPAEPRRHRVAEGVRTIDPWQDIVAIPTGSLDLVLHNHVLQEIPGNYTVFLQLLHSRLKDGGYHLFSVPISGGQYAEDGDTKMAPEARKARFGRERSLRRFGSADFEINLGAVFGIPRTYSLLDYLLPETLLAAAVSEVQWKLSSAAVFCVRR